MTEMMTYICAATTIPILGMQFVKWVLHIGGGRIATDYIVYTLTAQTRAFMCFLFVIF